MASAVLPVVEGLSALAGMFGGGDKYRYKAPPPFTFTPDPNDPQLQMLRRQFLFNSARSRQSNVNEIARAGLLGSSAAFNVLQGGSADQARGLADITSQEFARRRLEALQLYENQLGLQNQLQLAQQSHGFDLGNLRLANLNDIGSILGDLLNKYQNKDTLTKIGALGPTLL